MKSGFFITFEGIEGCGKSTQMKLAASWLEERKYSVCCTREPGGTEFGSQIRKLLLSESSTGLAPLSEALLYMADRFQHIQDVIRPALQEGKIVLCDRYHDSTIAYQGYARRIPLELLDAIWSRSGSALEPHLTILLDLDPAVGIARSLRKLASQQVDESRFEKEALPFHIDVRNGFLILAEQHPHRVRIVDASGSVESIHQQVLHLLKEQLQ
jgi:dTMP kinase